MMVLVFPVCVMVLMMQANQKKIMKAVRAHLNDALSIAKCTYAADDITLG